MWVWVSHVLPASFIPSSDMRNSHPRLLSGRLGSTWSMAPPSSDAGCSARDPGARRPSLDVTLAVSLPVCPLCGPVSDAGPRSCCSLISVIGVNLSEETSLVKSAHGIPFIFLGLSNIDIYSVFCLCDFVFAKTQGGLQCIFFNLAFRLKLHLVIFFT